jgi:hypothetical protein
MRRTAACNWGREISFRHARNRAQQPNPHFPFGADCRHLGGGMKSSVYLGRNTLFRWPLSGGN